LYGQSARYTGDKSEDERKKTELTVELK
jgi:hypothetical protein